MCEDVRLRRLVLKSHRMQRTWKLAGDVARSEVRARIGSLRSCDQRRLEVKVMRPDWNMWPDKNLW